MLPWGSMHVTWGHDYDQAYSVSYFFIAPLDIYQLSFVPFGKTSWLAHRVFRFCLLNTVRLGVPSPKHDLGVG